MNTSKKQLWLTGVSVVLNGVRLLLDLLRH
jgi:hypothetical protein